MCCADEGWGLAGVAFSAYVLAAYVPQVTMMMSFYALMYIFIAVLLLLFVLWIPSESWLVGLLVAAVPLALAFPALGYGQWFIFSEELRDPKEAALWVGMLPFEKFWGADKTEEYLRLYPGERNEYEGLSAEEQSERAQEDMQQRMKYKEARRGVHIVLTRVFFENIFQLWLQASFFSYMFDTLSETGRWKALASILLGLATSAAKIPSIAFPEGIMDAAKQGHPIAILLLLLICVVVAGPLVAVAAKVGFAFTCPSHMWGVTTGCVESP